MANNYKIKMKDIQNKYKFKIFCAGYEYDDTELRDAINQRALISEAGRYVELELNPNTYVLTAKLRDKNNNVISTSTPIDLPLESMIVDCNYDATTKSLIVTLQNGNTTSIPLGDLIDGLATEEDLNEVRDNLEVVQNELNQYKTIYNVLPKVEDEGEALTLNDTGNASLKIDLKGNTSQDGEPTPEPPQDMHVVSGDNEINVCGKNLFNKDSVSIGYLKEDGTLSTDTVYRTSAFMPIRPNTTYYKTSTGSPRTKYFDINKVPLNTTTYWDVPTGESAGTFTTPNNAYYLRFSFPFIGSSAIDASTIMVKEGTDTTYEPYQGNTYNIDLPEDMELCKIGDYQDRIYKDSGKWYIEKQIGKVVLDGSEGSWRRVDIYQGISQFEVSINNVLFASDRVIRTLSNFFKGIPYSNSWSYDKSITSVYANALRVMTSMYSSVDAFKTWLSTHNTIVYYVLETQTTTEITDTTLISQLDELESAMSYKGQTNISQINNDAPFIISASALYDLNNLVTRVAILETE